MASTGLAYSSLFFLVATLGAGCKEQHSNYCENAPFHNCMNVDADTSCASNDECAAPTPACDVTGSKTCVQCIAPDQISACTGVTPTCGADHACRACTAHTDCASSVCLPDGSCSDGANVAFVAPNGSGSACSKAMPCGTLAAAIATNKPVVKIGAGLVKDTSTTTIDGKAVTILADTGAKLDRDLDGPILEVKSANADVKIYDLEITGASGAAGANGIDLLPNGGTPKLTLTRVTVAGNNGVGISSSGGSLTVRQSVITGNVGGGIGITSAATFDITNNFVYRNGNTSTASFGGISAVPSGTSKLEFNTIVDNQASGGAASAGGVFCDQSGFVAASNIIFRNTGGTAGNVQTFGNCTYGNSFVNAGTGAVDNTPGFAHPNTQPFDYHLSATTPTTIVDAAGACTGIDFDGEARPIGAACDLGADERAP